MSIDEHYARTIAREVLIRQLKMLADLAFDNNIILPNGTKLGSLLTAIIHDLQEQERVN